MRGFAVIDDLIEFKHIRLAPGDYSLIRLHVRVGSRGFVI